MNARADAAEANAKTLGRRIAKQRSARGWKQRELARRMGISPNRLSRIERGAWPRRDELAALRQALGLGIDEMIFGEPPSSLPGEAERLARALKEVAPPEDWDAMVRCLRALLEGYRTTS